MAVDANHVYSINWVTGSIGRANLDGTGVNDVFITGVFVTPSFSTVGVAVDAGHQPQLQLAA